MIILKKEKGAKRFKQVKSVRTYAKAWCYIADELVRIDYRLHVSGSHQYLCDGYTKRKVFHFGMNIVSRKGVKFKMVFN